MDNSILDRRIELAMTPTPLHRLDQQSRIQSSEIWIKRDDMTGSQLSGNKIRKLEYLLYDAKVKGADTVITCGGEQSNHCRATALASRRLGMDSHLVLRRTGEGPTGNWLMDILAGATFRWIGQNEYDQRDIILEQEAEKLRKMGKTPYIIPEGGSNPIGILGYIKAAFEIIEQCKNLSVYPENITTAVGTTGTYAGLKLGFKLAKYDVKVFGISTGTEAEIFIERAKILIENTIREFDLKIDDEIFDIEIDDSYIGDGYGIVDCDTAEFIIRFAQLNGIILDPTYTAKGFMGGLDFMPKPSRKNGINILLHTGGLFGLFAKGQVFRELNAAMSAMPD